KARHEMVLAQREPRDPIHRIGNDPRALGEFAHLQPLRSSVAAEARADLAFGIRMQTQRHARRRRGALARVVVGRRADPPKAEDDIARGETALEGRRQALGIVAEILRPGEAQAAPREGTNEEGEMLVLALSYEDFIPDDEGAKRHVRRPSRRSCRLLGPSLQVLEATNMLAVDEDLRHRRAPGNGADHARADAMLKRHLGIVIAEILEEHFGLRAIVAAFARENRHLIWLLRLGIY